MTEETKEKKPTTSTTGTDNDGGGNNKNKLFKCECGKCQIRLKGEPINNFNCHCHSCVASARYIEDNHGVDGGGKTTGTSQLVDTDLRTGSAMSIWYIKDIDFFQGSPNLGYCKVGENGIGVRSYTKCCGTQAFLTGKDLPVTYRHFNRNCIYNEDDEGGSTKKFVPDHPIPNVMLSFAFVDASQVKDEDGPKYKFVPLKMLLAIGNMIQFYLGWTKSTIGEHNGDEPSMWIASKDVTEIVPITWEK